VSDMTLRTEPHWVIVMGVSGCGKSTVAHRLALTTGAEFLDADDFHPAENVAKMAAGIALNDEDRAGWLRALNQELKQRSALGTSVFLACSALKEKYREVLREGIDSLEFVYLKGSKELIRSRMEMRSEHFFKPELLDSQFAALEEPEVAVILDSAQPLELLVQKALHELRIE